MDGVIVMVIVMMVCGDGSEWIGGDGDGDSDDGV